MNESPINDDTLPEREQEILDTALLESDQLLARSLHDDDLRRRRRRLLSLALILGGVVMGTVLVAILMGWLTFGQVASADAAKPTPEQRAKAEALSAEGWQLWKKGDHFDAAKQFAQAVKLTPKDANTWNGYGWALFNSGQRTKAVDAFEKCVKLSPKHPAGLNGLGQIYLAEGDLPKAEKYLKLAAPQAPAAWFGLARVYLLTEKFKLAEKYAAKVVDQSPDNEYANKMLAAAKAGKLDDELQQMISPTPSTNEKPAKKKKPAKKSEAAPGAVPTDTSADFKRGWQMFFKQKYPTSERLFRRVLENDPKNPHAMNGLGWSLHNQGKSAEAKPILEQAIKLAPNHGGAISGLASVHHKLGHEDEAIKLWEQVAKDTKTPNDATVMLAEIYLKREQYEKAAKCYEKAVQWFPDQPEFQKLLMQAKEGLAEKKQ